MISGDARDVHRHASQFGIYNLARYDDNNEAVYEHVDNKKYILQKSILGEKVRGWLVRNQKTLKLLMDIITLSQDSKNFL